MRYNVRAFLWESLWNSNCSATATWHLNTNWNTEIKLSDLRPYSPKWSIDWAKNKRKSMYTRSHMSYCYEWHIILNVQVQVCFCRIVFLWQIAVNVLQSCVQMTAESQITEGGLKLQIIRHDALIRAQIPSACLNQHLFGSLIINQWLNACIHAVCV